ncbi:hypothetical protein L3i22_058120 [Actinoplanes sp. L3-i22]|nr:hypothetical protein L3i22_058120 [Actinoplanes sp. L3-i22]
MREPPPGTVLPAPFRRRDSASAAESPAGGAGSATDCVMQPVLPATSPGCGNSAAGIPQPRYPGRDAWYRGTTAPGKIAPRYDGSAPARP